MAAGDVETNITSPNANKGAILDGVANHLTLGGVTDLTNITEEFTFSCRIFMPKLTASNQTLLDKSDPGITKGFRIRINGTTDTVTFFVSDGAQETISSNDTIIESEWTHLLVKTNSVIGEMFINGSKQTDIEPLDGPITPYDTAAGIIGTKIGGADPFKGTIADIRIYNKFLSDEEAIALNNKEDITRGLIHKWDFLDNTYNDQIGTVNAINTGTYISITDENISAAVKADRTTANDIYLIASSGNGKQVITTIIEET